MFIHTTVLCLNSVTVSLVCTDTGWNRQCLFLSNQEKDFLLEHRQNKVTNLNVSSLFNVWYCKNVVNVLRQKILVLCLYWACGVALKHYFFAVFCSGETRTDMEWIMLPLNFMYSLSIPFPANINSLSRDVNNRKTKLETAIGLIATTCRSVVVWSLLLVIPLIMLVCISM